MRTSVRRAARAVRIDHRPSTIDHGDNPKSNITDSSLPSLLPLSSSTDDTIFRATPHARRRHAGTRSRSAKTARCAERCPETCCETRQIVPARNVCGQSAYGPQRRCLFGLWAATTLSLSTLDVQRVGLAPIRRRGAGRARHLESRKMIRLRQQLDEFRQILGNSRRQAVPDGNDSPPIERWTWDCGCILKYDGNAEVGDELAFDWERCAGHLHE